MHKVISEKTVPFKIITSYNHSLFYVTCHKNLISDWNWNSYFLYQLLYYEHYNWLNATWAFLVPFVWNSCCPCIMIYWLVDACKLGAFCCHCMLNGDQCFYKRIEQQQKKSFKKFGMWFWFWNLMFFLTSDHPGYCVAEGNRINRCRFVTGLYQCPWDSNMEQLTNSLKPTLEIQHYRLGERNEPILRYFDL